MRFLADGIDIPDDLLRAWQNGRLMLFCGAGVSAAAKLPGAPALIEKMAQRLGSERTDELIEKQDFDFIRSFSELGKEFSANFINQALANALKPAANADLSAHENLLKLAQTPTGQLQLITTNFDCLFEQAYKNFYGTEAKAHIYPHFPDNINGIIHLHGRIKANYLSTEGEVIASKASFGSAYMVNGLAAQFFQKIISEYTVLFIGYAADDLPIQYMLESLSKETKERSNLYAFAPYDNDRKTEDGEKALWFERGVQAITYNSVNYHKILWETVAKWASYSDNLDILTQDILALAAQKPSALKSFEREQVAWLVSTIKGAQAFAEAKPIPPAEWLCVFDSAIRYASHDLFSCYCLKSDPSLQNESDERTQEISASSWNAFTLNAEDKIAAIDDSSAQIAIHWASYIINRPPRLARLMSWIADQAADPIVLWWLARQNCAPEDIQRRILQSLSGKSSLYPLYYRLFGILNRRNEISFLRRKPFEIKFTNIEERIQAEGWNSETIRAFSKLFCPIPILKIPQSFLPAENEEKPISFKLSYPLGNINGSYAAGKALEWEIPLSQLPQFVKNLRESLEQAIELTYTYGSTNIYYLATASIEENSKDNNFNARIYTNKLVYLIYHFAKRFRDLRNVSQQAAQHEFMAWPQFSAQQIDNFFNSQLKKTEHDVKTAIFTHLRIWAAQFSECVGTQEFHILFEALSDSIFWNSFYKKDILITLAARWNNLNITTQTMLENKIFAGDPFYTKNKDEFHYHSIIQTMEWLKQQGCFFSEAALSNLAILHNSFENLTHRNWQNDDTQNAMRNAMEIGPARLIKNNEDYTELLNLPITEIVEIAKAISEKFSYISAEWKIPFTGLSKAEPIKAFAALCYAAKQGEFPEELWKQFFNAAWKLFESSTVSELKKKRLIALLMGRLNAFPSVFLARAVSLGRYCGREVVNFYFAQASISPADYAPAFDKFLVKIITALQLYPETAAVRSHSYNALGKEEKTDWYSDAINSPLEFLLTALWNDKRLPKRAIRGIGLPKKWLSHIKSLLSLPPPLCCYSICLVFRSFNYLELAESDWAGQHLLPILDEGSQAEKTAAWQGFFAGQNDMTACLKDKLINLATATSPEEEYSQNALAFIFLGTWLRGREKPMETPLSDAEFRNILLNGSEELRIAVLNQYGNWKKLSSPETKELCSENLSYFIENIWPKQKRAQTPESTQRLCILAFSCGDDFPAIAKQILLYLTQEAEEHSVFSALMHAQHDKENLFKNHPRDILMLLDKVFNPKSSGQFWQLREIVQKLYEADNSFAKDSRWLRLDKAVK